MINPGDLIPDPREIPGDFEFDFPPPLELPPVTELYPDLTISDISGVTLNEGEIRVKTFETEQNLDDVSYSVVKGYMVNLPFLGNNFIPLTLPMDLDGNNFTLNPDFDNVSHPSISSSYTYKVTAGKALSSDSTFFRVTVNDIDRSASVDSISGLNTVYSNDLNRLKFIISDDDGDSLEILNGLNGITLSNGSLDYNFITQPIDPPNDPLFIFTAPENFEGDVQLNYTLSDGKGGEIDVQRIIKIVEPPNSNTPPALTGEKFSFTDSAQGQPIFISQEELLQGFTDVDGDRLQITELDITKHGGTLSFQTNPDGWIFTPDENFTGNLDFSYVIHDNNGGSVSVNNFLNIVGPETNLAPIISGPIDLGSIDEDNSLVITANQLLFNAFDPDMDPLSIDNLSIFEGQGQLIDNQNDTWTFNPASDWNGEVKFSYNVTDFNIYLHDETLLPNGFIVQGNDLGATSGNDFINLDNYKDFLSFNTSEYKLMGSPHNPGEISSIRRNSDYAFIPLAEDNRDYQIYLNWLAEGNKPDPIFTYEELRLSGFEGDDNIDVANIGLQTGDAINFVYDGGDGDDTFVIRPGTNTEIFGGKGYDEALFDFQGFLTNEFNIRVQEDKISFEPVNTDLSITVHRDVEVIKDFANNYFVEVPVYLMTLT